MSFQIPEDRTGLYDADWCYDCERHRDHCACEELCDWLREANPGTDVCVPAVSGPLPIVAPAQWEKDALAEIDTI